MALDKKITDLTAYSSPIATDEIPIVDVTANETKKISWIYILDALASVFELALGFTAENVANKDTDGTLAANSDTKYPSQKATKTYADTKQPILVSSEQVVDTGNGMGSTNTKIRRFTNLQVNTGSAITRASSAANGDSFTINEAGLYAIFYSDSISTGTIAIGVSVNSNQLTTNIGLITAANRIGLTGLVGPVFNSFSIVVRLAVNDVIRAHTNAAMDNTTASVSFRIIKISA